MQILVLAIVGAFIGYITNVFAIKLLFRPIKPSRILKIQGVIPKRHHEIAKSIAEVVEENLLSINDIVNEIGNNIDKKEILNTIKQKILIIIRQKFKLYVMFSSVIDAAIDDIFETEGEKFLNEIMLYGTDKIGHSISTKKIIEDKILELDLLEMEEIIIKIVKNELTHIEYLGGVLGFIIGIIQGLIIFFM